jgi:hypothetical protein
VSGTAVSIEPSVRVDLASADRAAVGRVAGHVEVEDIRLVWARAALNVLPDEVDDDWSAHTFIGYDAHAHARLPDVPSFTARVAFAAGYDPAWVGSDKAPEYDPDDPPAVDVAAMFELSYALHEGSDLDDDDLEHFSAFNAAFNAWPYWRELAQTSTSRMRIPVLLVPLLQVPVVQQPADDDHSRGE